MPSQRYQVFLDNYAIISVDRTDLILDDSLRDHSTLPYWLAPTTAPPQRTLPDHSPLLSSHSFLSSNVHYQWH